MLVTLRGRLAYQDIWQAKASQDGKGEPKFGCVIIVDPKSVKDKGPEAVKATRAAIKAVAKEKWKAKADGILRVLEGENQKFCWFEEDKLNAEGEIVDGFEDMFYLSCKSPIQPTIIDRDRTELTRKDGRPYNGCYCVFKVDIWAQDNTYGKGIRAQVQGIQFLRDGDAFGGGTRSKVDDFEDLSDLGEDDGEDTPPKKAAGKAKAKARPPVDEDEDDIG